MWAVVAHLGILASFWSVSTTPPCKSLLCNDKTLGYWQRSWCKFLNCSESYMFHKLWCRLSMFAQVCMIMSMNYNQTIFHQKPHLRWLPSSRKHETNNMKTTSPTWCQHKSYQTQLYSVGLRSGLRWVHWGLHWFRGSSRWVCLGSHGVREAFWIPTCWYWQRKMLTLGAMPNARPKCEWVCVLVEYRL